MVQWEILLWRHPERFAVNTNEYLSCSNCNEKLCAHKHHLNKLWGRLEVYTVQRTEQMRTGINKKVEDVALIKEKIRVDELANLKEKLRVAELVDTALKRKANDNADDKSAEK